MSKIISLIAENVKRLSAVKITPDKQIVVIGGRNGQGKSSVLDCIAMALGGKDQVPDTALRKGAKNGSITIDLGDIKVLRKFTAGGTTSLTVSNAEGAKYNSPQAVLDALVGKLSFDPLGFLRLKARDQADTLRELAGVDLGPIEKRRAEAYALRTEANSEVKRLTGALESKVSYPDAPKEIVSAGEITAKITEANQINTANAAERSALQLIQQRGSSAKSNFENHTATVERLKKELEEAETALREAGRQLADIRREYVNQESKVKLLVDADPAAFDAQLAEIETTNAKVRANIEKAGIAEELRDAEKNARELDQRVKDIDAEKADLLKSSNIPVDGLTFDEGCVYFGDVPLDQASGAEQLRVSIAIASAMNPKLRVMICKDGALLDDDSLALLAAYADANDMQIWLENCHAKGAEATVIIADGMVEERKDVA